jgi:hypothetical protein
VQVLLLCFYFLFGFSYLSARVAQLEEHRKKKHPHSLKTHSFPEMSVMAVRRIELGRQGQRDLFSFVFVASAA